MENSNKQGTAFLRLANFSEDANKVVNKAIFYATSEDCSEINLVHLFLALVEKTELGLVTMEKMGTTFDMLYGSYQTLAESGNYGCANGDFPDIPLKMFTRCLFMVIAECTHMASMNNRKVTPEDLMNATLDLQCETLTEYLDYIGWTYEDFMNTQYREFGIPEPLMDFVEDITMSDKVAEMSIDGVDGYIDEMFEVLSRKTKANPCLVGEAGVGKTTVVYGLARRLMCGEAPEKFSSTHVVYINSALLTAGTRYRGDFEARMKLLIDWASDVDVILFLDELHTFINCGKNGDDVSNAAGNMLKKSLSDGSIKIIGATTLKEYHKYIEGDTAFDRRLQKIEIKEPSVENAIKMIKNTIADYEQFHEVLVPEKVIEMTVKLSDRYIKDKYLPDKAYTILDQALAKVKLRGNQRKLEEKDVLDVVSKITQINVNKLGSSEQKQLLGLEDTIGKSLIGQESAVKTVAKAIRRAKAGVREENKPLASFMFVGPTGVGKTELCKVLSKEVAIGDTTFIKIDMSEYSEKGSISKMIGSAPGYVGYGEGGQLTEKVKHNPYSIILFDEIEKANPEVYNIFLQLLDEGKLTDGQGQTVDFTNCILVMTSNAGYGADGMAKGKLGFNTTEETVSDREREKMAMKALEETFKPEFLNRLDNIVIFEKLTKEQCKLVTGLLLEKLHNRVLEQGIELEFSDSLIDNIVEHGYSDKYGARNIRREIQDTVEDIIADAILDGTLSKGTEALVTIDEENGNNVKIEKKVKITKETAV